MVTSALPAAPAPVSDTRSRWVLATAPAGLYLAARGLGMLIWWWLAAANHHHIDLHQWDGHWYLAVAEHGYSGVGVDLHDGSGHHTPTTAMAFFPGFPALIRLAEPLFMGNFLVTALVISWTSGVVAAYGVTRLTRHITGSDRAALIMVALVATAPMSVVYGMVYSEAVLVAVSVWALVGVLERRWMLAGWCALGAGLLRPTAAAVIAVVMLGALLAVRRRQDTFGALTAAILAPTGMVVYLTWVAIQSGSLVGYTQIQKHGWNVGFDGGKELAAWAVRTWTTDSATFTVLTVWIVLAQLLLLGLSARRMPWQLWLYACLISVAVLGMSGAEFSKVRLLLPATVVLLLPVAKALGRARPASAVIVTAGIALAGLWFGAYSLTVWPYGV